MASVLSSDLIGGGGGCSCILLLHLASTCPGAGHNLCALHWCAFSSISWCKYSTCTCGGQNLLQLALVVFILPSAGANTLLVHVVVISCCNLCWWCFSFQPLAQIFHLHSCNFHCAVVVVCGGSLFICGSIYIIYKCNYMLTLQFALCTLAVCITSLVHAYFIRVSACMVPIS